MRMWKQRTVIWKKEISSITSRIWRGLLAILSRGIPFRKRKIVGAISRTHRCLLVILSGTAPILVILCLFFGRHTLPRYSDRLEILQVTLLLSSPRYFAVNEEEELRIAVKNEKSSPTRVNFRLEGSNNIPVFFEQSGTNVILDGEVQSGIQIERKVKIFIPYDFGGGQANDTLRKSLGLKLRGDVESQAKQWELPLSTVPIPWTRTLFGIFFSLLTGVFAWVAKEWWDLMKEARGKAK